MSALAFAPDGMVVYSAGEDQELTAWSLRTREKVFHSPLGDVPGLLTLSRDGKVMICSGSRYHVEVDAVRGTQISKGPPSSVPTKFSSD